MKISTNSIFIVVFLAVMAAISQAVYERAIDGGAGLIAALSSIASIGFITLAVANLKRIAKYEAMNEGYEKVLGYILMLVMYPLMARVVTFVVMYIFLDTGTVDYLYETGYTIVFFAYAAIFSMPIWMSAQSGKERIAKANDELDHAMRSMMSTKRVEKSEPVVYVEEEEEEEEE